MPKNCLAPMLRPFFCSSANKACRSLSFWSTAMIERWVNKASQAQALELCLQKHTLFARISRCAFKEVPSSLTSFLKLDFGECSRSESQVQILIKESLPSLPQKMVRYRIQRGAHICANRASIAITDAYEEYLLLPLVCLPLLHLQNAMHSAFSKVNSSKYR